MLCFVHGYLVDSHFYRDASRTYDSFVLKVSDATFDPHMTDTPG